MAKIKCLLAAVFIWLCKVRFNQSETIDEAIAGAMESGMLNNLSLMINF